MDSNPNAWRTDCVFPPDLSAYSPLDQLNNSNLTCSNLPATDCIPPGAISMPLPVAMQMSTAQQLPSPMSAEMSALMSNHLSPDMQMSASMQLLLSMPTPPSMSMPPQMSLAAVEHMSLSQAMSMSPSVHLPVSSLPSPLPMTGASGNTTPIFAPPSAARPVAPPCVMPTMTPEPPIAQSVSTVPPPDIASQMVAIYSKGADDARANAALSSSGSHTGSGSGSGSSGFSASALGAEPPTTAKTAWGIELARLNAHNIAQERWREVAKGRPRSNDRTEHRLEVNRKSAKVSRERRREYVKQLERGVEYGEKNTSRLKREVDAVDEEKCRLREQLEYLQNAIKMYQVQQSVQ